MNPTQRARDAAHKRIIDDLKAKISKEQNKQDVLKQKLKDIHRRGARTIAKVMRAAFAFRLAA